MLSALALAHLFKLFQFVSPGLVYYADTRGGGPGVGGLHEFTSGEEEKNYLPEENTAAVNHSCAVQDQPCVQRRKFSEKNCLIWTQRCRFLYAWN